MYFKDIPDYELLNVSIIRVENENAKLEWNLVTRVNILFLFEKTKNLQGIS
jgi:hypothetical protein